MSKTRVVGPIEIIDMGPSPPRIASEGHEGTRGPQGGPSRVSRSPNVSLSSKGPGRCMKSPEVLTWGQKSPQNTKGLSRAFRGPKDLLQIEDL